MTNTMTNTEYAHLVRDEDGVVRVRGKGFKVVLLIGEHIAWGANAAGLAEAHPPLTLGEAHSLLAYYYDHKGEVEAELRRRELEAEQLCSELEDPAFMERVRADYARWRAARMSGA